MNFAKFFRTSIFTEHLQSLLLTLAFIQDIAEILDFGVSAAILNTIDISRRWSKLNFGPMRDQFKEHHFREFLE